MSYIFERPDEILDAAVQHLFITLVVVLGATVIGVLLGILITRLRQVYTPILTVAGIIYTIPSLAMFVLMIPLLGIGFRSAVVALVLYSLLIVIRNTAVGIDGVDPNIKEAARGVGMTPLGILFRIELPLALPVIFAGVRIATVSAISLATIAAFIGAGGIGTLIFEGLSSQREDKIVAGAFAASIMAIGAEILLRQVERGSAAGSSARRFKSLGEYFIDFWDFLRRYPDVLVLLGSIMLLFSYFQAEWVHPYLETLEQDEPAALIQLESAGFNLRMTGADLVQIETDAPVQRSLQILPWLAGLAGLFALANLVRHPGGPVSADVTLLCGILIIFPLTHFYYETLRATGDLGTSSELFRAIRSQIGALSDARVSPRLDTLTLQSGYYLSIVGLVVILAGSYLKSLFFRRQTQQRQMERRSV